MEGFKIDEKTGLMVPDESKFVRHYVPEYETTIRILREPRITSVLELDTWRGQPEDHETVERWRHAVLLDTDMNGALRVQHDLINGEPRMLRTLLKMFKLYDVPLVMQSTKENAKARASLVLGFDFFSQTPRITIID